MIIKKSLFKTYKEKIKIFEYSGDESLHDFIIEKEGKISVCYSTHNEYINTQAEILIVGICPGRQQMIKSLKTAKEMLALDCTDEEILIRSKLDSRLVGSTRDNLIDMLKEIGLKDIAQLFHDASDTLHMTSLIRYPIFTGDAFKNYNGHTPKLNKNELIMKYSQGFLDEVMEMKDLKLIIPLGNAVEEFLMEAYKDNPTVSCKILKGLSHPSGANGHRKKVFEKNRSILKVELDRILSMK
jgi:hypothetical protein